LHKLIFIGDTLFQGQSGYQELLISQLVLFDPRSALDVLTFPGPGAAFHEILKQAPMHIIGKSPDLVLIAAGYSDVMGESALLEIKERLDSVFNLLKDKTNAEILSVNLCTAFFKGDPIRLARCEFINAILGCYQGFSRYRLVDADAQAAKFLEAHHSSTGMKVALHKEGPVLTGLGALLLARLVAEAIRRWIINSKTGQQGEFPGVSVKN
jgi:hypothetical protein